ncbi:cation diffusion facilitator family transporter [Alteromonas lipolytica]|uniref:Cobalt transporter n=1 Tax=Alteromonas lipolytica TaxID=1856405 RepID=A0A1E8FB57_9ALTE|nr:cation diffusion facilitator family transporter [Alteromonas lipolytica]OFI33151.1 cobalt transporter [Alteromonas lipolytica]GGF62038.1 cobalt transporter [Alteromonas lipolytica]
MSEHDHSHGHSHNHAHAHEHGHHHGHHHHHHDIAENRISWAFWLNFSFTIIEFIGGWLTNSVAIMADAVHDLGDSLSIGLAWYLNKVGKRDATEQYSYGFKRLSLLGALINGLILVVGSVWVLTEAIPRLWSPEMPVAEGMIVLAILGIGANGYAAYKLHGGETLNEKVLNWHLLEDLLGWVAVLIVAIVLQFVDWPILDPLLSVVFTLFILFNVVKHVIHTVKLFLQANPDSDKQIAIRKALLDLEHVEEMHHVHFWSLDGASHVLTAHLVLDESLEVPSLINLKQQVARALAPFNLEHTTIEFEMPGEHCRDK